MIHRKLSACQSNPELCHSTSQRLPLRTGLRPMSCSTGLLELSGQSGQRRMSQRQKHHPDRHSRQCAQEARGVLAGRTRGNEPARRNGCRDTRPRGRDQPKLHAMFTDLHSAGGRMLTVVNASACATTAPAFRRPSWKGYSAPSCSPAAARTAPAVPDWARPSARKFWTRTTAPSRPSICLTAARRGVAGADRPLAVTKGTSRSKPSPLAMLCSKARWTIGRDSGV